MRIMTLYQANANFDKVQCF